MNFHNQKRKVEALRLRLDALGADYRIYQAVLTNLDETARELEQATIELREMERKRTVEHPQPLQIEIL